MIYAAHKILFLWASRNMKWAGHVACVGEKRSDCRILVGKREGKRPLGRRMGRWKNIEIHLKETGSGVVDRIHQAHVRDKWRADVNTVMNRQFPATVFSSFLAAASSPCLEDSFSCFGPSALCALCF